jgi:hypothetical protein
MLRRNGILAAEKPGRFSVLLFGGWARKHKYPEGLESIALQ